MASRKSRSRPVLQSDEESSSQVDKWCSSKQEKRDGKEKPPKRRKTTKVIPQKKQNDLVKSLGCIKLNALQVEIRAAVEDQFADSNFCEFKTELFKEDEPMMEITRQHCDSFALLYGNYKQQKNSFMQFQLQWHYHCSVFCYRKNSN